MLRCPCILGDTQRRARGAKVEVVPNKGEQHQKWLPSLAFSGAQCRREMLRHPCILGDPQRQVRGAKSEAVPNNGEQNQKWMPHLCLLRGTQESRNAT